MKSADGMDGGSAQASSRPSKLTDLVPSALYTVSEVAPLLRVRKRTIRKYCVERVFSNAIKLAGARWLIPGTDILELTSQEHPHG